MKLFNKQIGLIKSNIRNESIKQVTFDYSESPPTIFIHYEKSDCDMNHYETHKDALHDFLILIKKVKIKNGENK